MKTLLVVDCQYDFIHGTLACQHAPEAVTNIIHFINQYPHQLKVLYSCDDHSPTNQSFEINGGIWPVHCVSNQLGSQLDPAFSTDLKDSKLRPNETNTFYKGQDDAIEEYSAYHAKNKLGEILKDVLTDEVIVCGIASEYCVMESVKEILNAGKKVSLLKDGLGYVTHDTHQEALNQYQKMSIDWVEPMPLLNNECNCEC